MDNKNVDSLSKYAQEIITERIQNGTYPPGSKLSSQEIADSLGISRTPVIFAIDRLILEGFAEKKTERCTVVSQFKISQIKEILQVREMIELYTVPLIVKNLPFYPEKVNKLEEITETLAQTDSLNLKDANKLESEFHLGFISLCNNSRIYNQYKGNWGIGIVFTMYSRSKMPIYRLKESNENHRNMLKMAKNGNESTLREEIKKHLSIVNNTLDWVSSQNNEIIF